MGTRFDENESEFRVLVLEEPLEGWKLSAMAVMRVLRTFRVRRQCQTVRERKEKEGRGRKRRDEGERDEHGRAIGPGRDGGISKSDAHDVLGPPQF